MRPNFPCRRFHGQRYKSKSPSKVDLCPYRLLKPIRGSKPKAEASLNLDQRVLCAKSKYLLKLCEQNLNHVLQCLSQEFLEKE